MQQNFFSLAQFGNVGPGLGPSLKVHTSKNRFYLILGAERTYFQTSTFLTTLANLINWYYEARTGFPNDVFNLM